MAFIEEWTDRITLIVKTGVNIPKLLQVCGGLLSPEVKDQKAALDLIAGPEFTVSVVDAINAMERALATLKAVYIGESAASRSLDQHDQEQVRQTIHAYLSLSAPTPNKSERLHRKEKVEEPSDKK